MNSDTNSLDKLWQELYKRWDDAMNEIEHAERAGGTAPEELKEKAKHCKKELDELTKLREDANVKDIIKRIFSKAGL